VSSYGNDFNHDYHVSFTKDEMAEGKVYYNYGMTGSERRLIRESSGTLI